MGWAVVEDSWLPGRTASGWRSFSLGMVVDIFRRSRRSRPALAESALKVAM